MAILVPIDGSSQGNAALEEALDLFPDADLHVLYVMQVTKLPSDRTKSVAEIASDEAEAAIERATAIASEHGREIETFAKEGHAAKTIVSYAEGNDIDHIVMGSTGRSGVRRVLLGSVAESVIRRAPCSVTVARE